MLEVTEGGIYLLALGGLEFGIDSNILIFLS